ncbi:protein Gawky isoform X2 [Dermacentor andersoni]|uniref:protein Gawky isoform X2 n=1 Tax=Dermacentor andersoni TaxID=34620 RepID=UPI003B3A55F0
MQGDDKRSDLFLGQGNSGTWDTRPGSDSREAGNVSAAWTSGTALAQNSCRNPCERGMGGEDMVWTGDEASVIHRSSSLGGQCASTGPSNSQPGPRHNRGTSAASSSSWAVHRQGNPGKPGVVREIGSSGKPSNDSTSEGADQLLGAVGGSEEATSQPSSHPPQSSRNCRPPRLGLLGGGESSLNNGAAAPATGWGAPPPGPQGGWGSGAAQWGGAASTRGPEYATGGPNAGGDAGGASSPTKPTAAAAAAAAASSWGQGTVTKGAEASDPKSTTVATRNVLEEPMSELRRLAAFSEGWGQSPINQETPWDVPMSPGTKEPPTGAPWRAPVNNGTEVWENNMRSARAGGNKQPNPPQSAQGSSQCSQQQPWGSHTPTSHIGGTWGEEDEPPPSNMWTGVPTPSQQGGPRPSPEGPPSWGGEHHRGGGGGGGGGEKHWSGGPPPPPGSSWGGPDDRDSQGRVWGGGRPSHSMDDGPSGAWGGGPKGAGPPPSVGTWSPVGGPNGKREPSGWEEPSPPPSRRPVTNYDDGTALWGNPTRQGKVSHWKDMPSVKSICSGGGAPPGMLRMPKEGVWGGGGGGNKGPRGGNGTNWGDSSWEDHNKGAWGSAPPDQAYWASKPKPSWADGQIDTSTWGGPAKQGGKPLTKDLIYASKQFRILTDMGFKKEDVENALRINQMNIEDTLIDLRTMATRGNGSQDSGLLDGSDCGFPVGGRPKMRPDDDSHGPLGEPPFPGFHAAGGFQGLPVFGAGYGGGQGFKPPQVKGSNQGSNAPASLLNSTGMGGQNSSLTVGNSISSLSPALVQKILQQQQQQHFPGNAGGPAGIGARLGQPNVPSATQLRLLVQQIQMAVHAGHLNPQILNQPLAPQTLQLLYQLLQQIKVLHALQQQNQIVHKGPPNNPLQVSVQLTQTKQRILNLQNQIAAQQALFLKQQLPPPPQPPQQAPPHVPPPPTGLGCPPTPQDFLGAGKPGGAEGLHSDFRDLNLKDAVSQQQQHQQQQQQSRLNQWKLPSSLDEENKAPQQNGGGDFSRAPGPASKAGSLSSFLGGADGPWSSGACSQDGWPEAPPTTSCAGGTSSPGEGKDSGVGGYSLSDLVAEFEPGKPWKGASALKSAEDDPHLTPGSVVRSPLSVNTIKDSELFGGSWKQSPPGGEGSLVASLASLTSSTWAFTPAMHGSGNGSGGGSSKGNASKSSWGASSEHQAPTDPWNVGPKTRGPPPGLSSGWDQQPGSGSSFLMLRNLTQQIDGSTLKTLCMQHGPLQLFHLYLKHGLALVQYASREEAAKAQSALHNCVLSNTTMMAYIPSESEVAQFLQLGSSQGQHPSSQPQQHQQQMAWGAPTNAYHQPPQRPPLQYAPGRPSKQPTEPWNTTAPPPVSSAAAVSSSNASHLWSFPGSGSGLWAAPQTSQAGGVGGSNQMDHDHGGPGVPQSSLNSFLPGDLLSGESI